MSVPVVYSVYLSCGVQMRERLKVKCKWRKEREDELVRANKLKRANGQKKTPKKTKEKEKCERQKREVES